MQCYSTTGGGSRGPLLVPCLILLWCSMVNSQAAANDGTRVWTFVGTYTGGTSEGIYAVPFDTDSGTFGELRLAAKVKNPSFLAIHPSGKYLYSVGEVSDFGGQRVGAVHAFAIDGSTGQLTLLNSQSSSGSGPCHINVDATGSAVLVANYGGGSCASLAITEGGHLGEIISAHQHRGSSVTSRQKGPHAHSINLDPSNQFAVVADLGLDKVLVYPFDAATGQLMGEQPVSSVAVAPGAGPRHLAFHPTLPQAFVINELNNTIDVLQWDVAAGKFEVRQTIGTLPADYDGTSHTAEVVVHANGKFVYGSNRGHDSIAVYQAGDDGSLELLEIEPTGGKTPRNFAIDPSGRFLFAENQASDTIVVLAIDQSTGALTPTGEVLEVPSPVCVRFLAD